jgi:hypothetical protein
MMRFSFVVKNQARSHHHNQCDYRVSASHHLLSVGEENMHPTFQRRKISSIPFSTLLLGLLLLLLAVPVFAQDAPAEATAEPSEITLPVPAEATPIVENTQEPQVTAEAAPTQPVLETPVSLTSFADDFTDWAGEGWTGEGWALTEEVDNAYLATTLAQSSIAINDFVQADFTLSAQLKMDADNTAEILVRAGEESYRVVLNALGATRLYRGEALLAAGVSAASEEPTWFDVTITAAGATIGVSINGVPQIAYTDPVPLGAGFVIFSSGLENTGSVALDNVVAEMVDAATIIIALPATPEPVVAETETPLVEATEAPIATAEVVAETTTEPEATAEVKTYVVLSADFSTEPTEWTVNGASIVSAEEANPALLFAADSTFAPTDALDLAEFQLTARFNLLAAGDVALTLNPYRITINKAGVTLSHGDVVLAEGGAEDILPLNSWHNLSVTAQAGVLTVVVNDIPALVTGLPEDFVLTEFAFSATDSAMLDDVVLSGFGEQPEEVLSTPIPMAVDPATKVAPTLLTLVQAALSGDGETATAEIAARQLDLDSDGLLHLLVWFTEGSDITPVIAEAGGSVIVASVNSAEVYLPLSGIQTVIENSAIIWLDTPILASSTGPVGANSGPGGLQSFDALGVEDWHSATTAIRGAGVKIAVIDTGFNSSQFMFPGLGEYTCLASTILQSGVAASNNDHGASVIQVICDIAPQSQVYLYQANSYGTLRNAIAQARQDDMDVILIALDLGVAATPGDGTGNHNNPAQDPYNQISLARNEGRVVIAAAGNNNGRHTAFNYSGGLVTVGVIVRPSEFVNVSYSTANWFSTNNRPRITLGAFDGNSAGAPEAGDQLSPAGCTVNYDIDNDSINDSCILSVTVNGFFSGGGPVTVQIQVTGDGELTQPPAAIAYAGNIGRPADSPDAIAVGALCSDYTRNFEILPDSAKGPVYQANGTAPASWTFPLNALQTKPEIVSLASVDTSFGSVIPDLDGNYCGSGFSGTSAAAAHVAGLAALLKSNTTNVSMNGATATSFNPDLALGGPESAVDNILNYLQSRVVEMPFGSQANGFDMLYGAGMTVLGSPNFNLNNTINSNVPPNQFDLVECARFKYVGLANPRNPLMSDLNLLGTIAHPYLHPADALAHVTLPNTCVILMPGEYVSPLLINGIYGLPGKTPVTIVASYDDVTSAVNPPSIFWMNAQYYDDDNLLFGDTNVSDLYHTGQLYFNNGANGVLFSGFNFVFTKTQAGNTGNSIREPQVAIFYSSLNSGIRRSTMGEVTLDGITYPGWNSTEVTPIRILGGSHGTVIEDNTFIKNQVPSPGGVPATTADVRDSGTNTNRVVFEFNEVRGNKNLNSSFGPNDWSATFWADNSAVDVVNNAFVDNQAETIIQTRTTAPGQPGGTLESRIMGNVILTNTTDSNDILGSGGPLVNIFNVRNFYFLNNTVINNITTDSLYGALIARGDAIPDNFPHPGSITNDADQKWEIHNNLIYDNVIDKGLVIDTVVIDDALGYECDRIGSTANNLAAQHNWWFANVRADLTPASGGVCEASLQAGPNDNILGIDPATHFLGYFLNNDSLPGNNVAFPDLTPEYYAMRQMTDNPQTFSAAVDFGDEDLNGVLDPLDFVSDFSGRNNRIIDMTIANPSPPPLRLDYPTTTPPGATLGLIDIGAFEFSPLTINDDNDPDNPDFTLPPFVEDSSMQLDLDAIQVPVPGSGLRPLIEGGFGDLTFRINSYVVAHEYGVHCTYGTFTDLNRGFEVTGSVIKYCPPLHYYTDDVLTSNPDINGIWPNEVVVNYTVADESGTSKDGVLRFAITPADDTPINTVPGYHYTATGSEGAVIVQLRPYVVFNPFEVEFAQNDAADFPYVYDNPQEAEPLEFRTCENPALFDNPQLVSAFSTISIDAKITIVTNGGQSGCRDFTYTVEDRNGNTKQMRVTLRIFNTIPVKGLYDDSSFVFMYTNSDGVEPGDWYAESSLTSINNTLHTTTTSGDYASVKFRGTGFVLYLNGRYSLDEWQLRIFRETPAILELNPTNWVLETTSNGNVYRNTYSSGPTSLTCSTRALPLEANLRDTIFGGYTVACEGTTYGLYGLQLINRSQGYPLTVDAISVLDSTLGDPNPDPLQPGYYDVDQLGIRNIFNSQWQQVTQFGLSNGMAFGTKSTGSLPGASFSFTFTNATGFSLGTMLDFFYGATYRICVRNLTDAGTPDICQDYNNTPNIATTFTTYNVFRPFWGYNPDKIYQVTVSNINVPEFGRLLIDSIVIYPETLRPIAPMLGTYEDNQFEYFAFGNGIDDSWIADAVTYSFSASNGTATTMSYSAGSFAGPFAAFEIDANADTLYLKYIYTYVDSTQWYICIDRALGTAAANDFGNCIVVNTRPIGSEPGYRVIAANGTMTNGDETIQPTLGQLIIRESMFHNDTWGPGANGRHMVELFSVTNEQFSVDRVTVLNSNGNLPAGAYEDFTRNIKYFAQNTPGTFTESTPVPLNYTTNYYEAEFTLNTIEGFYDSGGSIIHTGRTIYGLPGPGGVGNAIVFNIEGTGFAPMFRMDFFSDAVKMCWMAPAKTAPYDSAEITDVLNNGTCHTVDNEAYFSVYQAKRPVLGLPNNIYTVVLLMEEDNNLPVPHLYYATPLQMWFDGVDVYNTDPSTLTALTHNTKNETSYINREVENKFHYFGTGWQTSAIYYLPQSNADYDTITVADKAVGAGIMFRVNGTSNNANALVIYRDMSYINADYEVCSYPVGAPQNRRCSTIDNDTGIGNQVPVTVYLNDTPAANVYIVTITGATRGILSVDAIKPVTTAPLTVGIHDDNVPGIRYDRTLVSVAVNGDMESDVPSATWTSIAPVSDNGRSPFYAFSGFFSYGFRAGGAGGGVASLPFAVQAGKEYTVIGRVLIPTNFNATLSLQLYNGGTPVGTAATLDANTLAMGLWHPVRFTYTPGANQTLTLRLTSSANSGTTSIYLDGVHITEGGWWQTELAPFVYYGDSVTRSSSYGAEANFEFTGTGYSIATLMDARGGETEICYGTATPNNCFTYQNEYPSYAGTITRTVVGLPNNTYKVRVRDVEDGYSDNIFIYNDTTARTGTLAIGSVAVDYVQVFNETLPPAITTSVDANDDYSIAGKPALQLLPGNRWRTFSGSEAAGYSNNSYVGMITPFNYLSYFDAGGVASLNLNLGAAGSATDEATIIVQAGPLYFIGSRDLLACVDGANGTVSYTGATTSYSLINSTRCALTSGLQSAPQVAFNKNNLPLLENTTASPVNRNLSLTTLGIGYFIIDGYQVIYGDQLSEGYYEDTIGNGILKQTGTWSTDNFFFHSGGTALVSTGAATMTFRIRNSTGFSLLTAFDYLGGNVNIRVQGEGALAGYDESYSLDTFTFGARYQSPYSIAGLKLGDYTVTISPTGPQPASRIVIDAVQVYGSLGSLGSLYDDAATDTNGKLLLTYGPKNNNTWTSVSNDFSHLYQTYHLTSTEGATVSFEVGAAEPATSIIIYSGFFTNTSVRVCWTKLTGTPIEPFCTTENLNGSIATTREVNTPASAPYVDANGHYNVTITNLTQGSSLYLDAIQVREGGNLVEGIYEATKLHELAPTAAVNLNGTWSTPFNYSNITYGDGGASLEFTIEDARGFSILLSEFYYSTTATYSLCVNTGATAGTVGSPQCNTINGGANTTPLALTALDTALGDYALTYVGLNPANLYTIRLQNTSAPALGRQIAVKSVHVVGNKPALQITSLERVENTDPQIRSLPFGGAFLIADGSASGLSESYTYTRGGGIYFEFRGKGFEYGRLAFVGFADATICYGALLTPSNNPTACIQLDGQGFYVHQTPFAVDTNDAVCDTPNGCWVTIRNRDQGLAMTMDFIRLFDPNAALTAGVYEESYPALRNFSGTAATGGTYTLDPVNLNVTPAFSDFSASGFSSRAYFDQAPNSAKFGGMFFRMTGTGFSVGFSRDYATDAIQICYQQNATTPQQVMNQAGGGANGCQKFENNYQGYIGKSQRSILGLPNGTYGVTVQMLGDDGLPIPHQYSYELPVVMKVDTVTIYDTEWFAPGNASWTNPNLEALQALTPGTRYEANYTNRETDNRFNYFGTWSTVTDFYASAFNYDLSNKAGSGIVFRTNAANSLVLYTTVNFGNSPLLICARALNMPLTQELAPNCQTITTTGTFAYQQPISFKFHPSNLGEYVVSISTLEDGNFYLDALEVVDTTAPLTAGFYEGTNPRINFDTNYVNLITNGSMESAGTWTAVNGATITQSFFPTYDGYSSYSITANNATQGIESNSFNLTAGKTYVVKARVYLYSGDVKMRLSTPNGMLEMTQNGIYNWHTFYQQFTPGLSGANKLQFVSNSGVSDFFIDAVSLSELGTGTWDTSYYYLYSGGSARRSTTPGAGATFDFTGTGFEIGMPRDPFAGEAQICYGLKATFPVGANCFTYQQENAGYDYDSRRIVAGLPLNTYTVRVNDAEDGYSTTIYGISAFPRSVFTGLNTGVVVDYVQIFNEPVAPMTPPGFYNENVATGIRHLQTYPPARWDDFTYPFAGFYSEQTYTAGIDQYGFLSYFSSGHTALLNVEVETGEPLTVILYSGAQYYYQSSQVLVCVGPQATGVKMSGNIIWTGFQFEIDSSTDCVLKNMATSEQISVNATELPELALPGLKTVMFTTLSPGTFYVDGFQVVGGSKLTPGVYDSFLPDGVLNFNNNVGAGQVESDFFCDKSIGWCQQYAFGSLGNYTAATQQSGASLNFSIEGTGFSVVTAADYFGGDIRICFKPAASTETFPPPGDLNAYQGNPPNKNDVWCDTVTTNTLSWDVYNADRYNPFFAYQYGFSYYGLPFGEYAVDIRVVDSTILWYESVQIDGIAVFDQATTIMQPGVYDNTTTALLYEPASNWTAKTSFYGLPFGPMNKTEHTSTRAGSIVQLNVSGNAMTLFQSTGFINSRDVRLCLVVAGEAVPCDVSTNDELAFAITNFSQYGFTSYGVPMMIYGMGGGEHTIILEQRDHTYGMSVDALYIQE